MDGLVMSIFATIGVQCKDLKELDGQLVPREVFLDAARYERVQPKLASLKKFLSSSALTSLQNTAGLVQRWPSINLARQLLKIYDYSMEPVRRSDGYDDDGKKRYRRYFLIRRVRDV